MADNEMSQLRVERSQENKKAVSWFESKWKAMDSLEIGKSAIFDKD